MLLLIIAKRGDPYLRSQVIHGTRSVVSHAKKKTDPLRRWINRLVEKWNFNKAVVALANKLMRIARVVSARGERCPLKRIAAEYRNDPELKVQKHIEVEKKHKVAMDNRQDEKNR